MTKPPGAGSGAEGSPRPRPPPSQAPAKPAAPKPAPAKPAAAEPAAPKPAADEPAALKPAPAKPAALKPAAPKPAPAAALSRPSAVLDEAHLADIEGALGRIRLSEERPQSNVRRRLVTFLAIVGPGLIVMVGDNDAGGVSTYAQAGQNYGYSLLWVLLLLIPVLIVNQEMVVRLGAVTGVGHARLINERFGRGWGWFSLGNLFLLNFLTIVTEFIGITLATDYISISRYVVVPTAAVALIAIMATASFRRWERAPEPLAHAIAGVDRGTWRMRCRQRFGRCGATLSSSSVL